MRSVPSSTLARDAVDSTIDSSRRRLAGPARQSRQKGHETEHIAWGSSTTTPPAPRSRFRPARNGIDGTIIQTVKVAGDRSAIRTSSFPMSCSRQRTCRWAASARIKDRIHEWGAVLSGLLCYDLRRSGVEVEWTRRPAWPAYRPFPKWVDELTQANSDGEDAARIYADAPGAGLGPPVSQIEGHLPEGWTKKARRYKGDDLADPGVEAPG